MDVFKKQWALYFGTAALLVPSLAFAQGLTALVSLVKAVQGVVNLLIPLLLALAIVAFFIGLVRYLFGKDIDKAKARDLMIWGIIIIFVMVAVWGLVQFIAGNLGIATGGSGTPPSVCPNGINTSTGQCN